MSAHSVLKAKVVKRLRAQGWLVTSYAPGTAGVADLICCAPGGLYVEIEIKTGAGRQTKLQRMRQLGIEAVGGRYEVVRS